MHEEDEGSLQAVDDGEDEVHHLPAMCLQQAQTPRAAQDADVRQRLERHQPAGTPVFLVFLPKTIPSDLPP